MLPATPAPLRLGRRDLLLGAGALALAPHRARAEAGLPGAGDAFSFDGLTEAMRQRAGEPYAPPARIDGPLGDLDYDDWRLIGFRDERARWTAPGDGFRLMAFHTGWLFPEPVTLHEVTGGRLRPLAFTAGDFRYGGRLAGRLPPDAPLPGVAGFRLLHRLNRPDAWDEVVAFLGASYFRALGRGSSYGLSARGLALNTASGRAEEFPRFSAFYLERPAAGAGEAVVSAALDSPSVTGAFRFAIRPGRDTVIEVTARLFFRAEVEEVGVAPLTSMFLFDEKNRAAFDDYRGRVHDSNGLRILRRDGDVLWRPLNNPPRLANSLFADPPARFGLHQRGREFRDYQDAEAHYERRPSVDVEPLGDWGPGVIRLVEIPTDLEVNDNIVAFWVPEGRGARAGEAREYRYRLHWGDLAETAPDGPAAVVSFKAGAAGVSGVANPADARKFVIDFAGGAVTNLPADAKIEPVVTLSRGTLMSTVLERVPEAGVWRLVLDVSAPGEPVVELTAHLAGAGQRLSETWLYQWVHEG